MIREIVPIILRFVSLLLIQGLLLINVGIFGGYGHLNLYTLVILLLPLKSPRLLDMLIALLLGLGIDMFYNSPGLHASACVLLAFLRPLVIQILTPRDDYDFTDRPIVSSLGRTWVMKYAGSLLFIHSLWLYSLESFDLSYFFDNLLKAVITSALTLLTMMIIDYLFARKAKVV